MNGYDGGRIARGWYLLGVSWRCLRERPSLMAFPALSAACTTVLALAIFTPIAAADSSRFALIGGIAAAAVPATFTTVFCNVAFVTMVQSHMRGEQPAFGDGLRMAWARKGAIFGWALISLVVGALLRAIEQIPGGGLVASLVSWLGGLAWALATFFVVPVLVVEGISPAAAIKRSALTFRERWGESLTGDITAGAAFGLLMIPGIITGAAGVVALGDGASGTGVVLIVVGVLLIAPLTALQSAVTQLFQLVVYREATEGAVPAPFTTQDTSAVFKPKRKRDFWHR